MGRQRAGLVDADYRSALDKLKYEVAQEIGYVGQNLDNMKYEVADELGLLDKINTVGWGNMTSRECGRIGGRIGGHLGGQMVKRMIEFAKSEMPKQQ